MQAAARYFTKERLIQLATTLVAHARRLSETIAHRGRRSKIRRLGLVESLELGNRRQLFLIACDSYLFLVGAGADGVGTLVGVPTCGVESDSDSLGIKSAYPARLAAFSRRRHEPWQPARVDSSHGLRLVQTTRDGLASQGQSAADTGKRLWT